MSERSIWRPYTQEKTAAPPLKITHAAGSFLHTEDGRKIFDGISSWWLITHGHCNPQIVEAVRHQAAKLDQVIFANFTHEPAEELAEQLLRMTPPQLTRVFFSDNGSTAVEAALKMAIQACAQTGSPRKTRFLAFASAYHGDTVGAMSVSGASVFNEPYRSTLFEVLRAKHPTHSQAAAEEYTRDFARLIAEHHETLAGVIVEPLIQGAGGMIIWPEAALREVARLCREFKVHLIFDEVMTGFGRTGRPFAMDRAGVVPDLVCLSKGLTGGTLPLAVTMAREEIYQAFLDDGRERMFFHGHSFTGNPISCAAAVANIKQFHEPEVLHGLARIEGLHLERAEEARRKLNPVDVRVCGTVAAVEMPDPQAQGYLADFGKRVAQKALDQGLFIRPLGHVFYLLPPFGSDAADLASAWDILLAALES